MNSYKSFKGFLLIILAILITACGCNSKKPENSSAAPTIIKWGVVKYNPYIMKINQSSEVIDFIEQKFNCSIEFEYYDSFNTKILNHMVNNQICPDILTMESMSVEGQFLAVNKLVLSADEIIADIEHTIPNTTWDFLSEADGKLYGIPGRYATQNQFDSTFLSQNEGIYVAQPYYDLLGHPQIQNMNDIIKISEQFVSNYSELRRTVDVPHPERESDFDAIPVVLGNSGSGIETLKHLFSIYPVFLDSNTVKHSIASPHWNELTGWLNDLSKLTLKSMSLSGKALDTALNGRCLFYIGSAACINNANFESETFKYQPIQNNVTQNTYTVNPYGSCQSYVFKNKDSEKTVKKLIRFLLSDEGMLLTKYGIENKHWIPTGDSSLQLDWVTERLKSERSKVLEDTGIGQLLFFTSLENDNPHTPDVLISEKNAFFTTVLNFSSGSNESLKLEKLSGYEIDICQRASSLDENEHPQKHSVIESDIIHFPLYEQQYKIESLEERFDYWIKQNIFGTVI